MLMNLKEKDRYVANHDEGLTLVDFGNYVILAEKRLLCCQPRQEQRQEEEEGIAIRWSTRSDCGRGERGRALVMKTGCEGWGSNVLAIDGAEEIPLQVTAVEAEAARQFPRLAFAQINFSDRVNVEESIANLAFEVIINKFLVGVESKESAANRGCSG
ncbi:hypothetical protein B296_00052554 [Ensete ventricosum]|uniref:Uncharacterized protein n=1 Tax=Ensete ventricosum TaxID=4639 RepID=A0A426XNN4_ENSVE|nr:hypothetical protein B296_00052554 [Ensete ventricosum]